MSVSSDLCDSCFYRDYLPDYEPRSNCLKDRAETGVQIMDKIQYFTIIAILYCFCLIYLTMGD